jgi:hypothetical protein
MKLKRGVKIQGLDPRMRVALVIAGQVYRKYGKELVVTSALDGSHTAGSLHWFGQAVDLRIRFWPRKTATKVRDEIEKRLYKVSGLFDVILESDHIHLELDDLEVGRQWLLVK